MDSTKIFIAAHKHFVPPKDKAYIPLQVGAFGKESFDNYERDDNGENISAKNPFYCELTGLYWVWKNVSCDVVGLVHYRRFFYPRLFCKRGEVLSGGEIKMLLSKYDVIVPLRGFTYRSGNVTDQYLAKHMDLDLKITKEVIAELYPDYMDAYNKVMEGYYYTQYNMMISKKELFDTYCEWLFSLMFEIEQRVEISLEERDSYNRRVFGFLSERLFNVWLCKNNQYSVCELPVFNIEGNAAAEKMAAAIKKYILIRGKKLF